MRTSLPVVVVVMLAAQAASALAADPPATVRKVDLQRYAGRWYEVARFPNRFQKQCAGDVIVEYTTRPDGRIDVVNTCRTRNGTVDKAAGVARLATNDGSNAKLEVRFAPAFLSWLSAVWGDYWILELAPDYSYAVVGDRNREYLWVLSRSPSLPDDVYADLQQRVAAKGFDASRLQKTANKS